MSIQDAKKIADKYAGWSLGNLVYDDGEFYIFTYSEEIDVSPVAVNKSTGEAIDYFPPDHDLFATAKEIKIN